MHTYLGVNVASINHSDGKAWDLPFIHDFVYVPGQVVREWAA